MMVFQIILTTVLATLLSFIATPISIFLAWRYRLIDNPESEAHKIHKAPMPRAGGLIIFSVLVLGSAVIGIITSRPVAPIVLASVIILAFGIWDDINGILAPWKILGQALATLLLISQGIQIHFLGNTFLDLFFTFLWVIGITNAFNLVDSMDGLATGLGGITAIFLIIGTFFSGQAQLTLLSAILLGACVGVFYFNYSPSRLFLGDSGSQLLGFTLAALALKYNPQTLVQASSWFVPILLFSIPIFDTTLVTISRLRRRVPIYKASRDHTYHRLVALGLSPKQSVLTMHLTAILIDCLAYGALFLPPLWANTLFGLIVLSGFSVIFWLDSDNKGLKKTPTT
jgi:UDP-GlcNAc:undecaprenyl-phosphate/decaprenyl-phosphate GlcNAc-1-phosphate transferase